MKYCWTTINVKDIEKSLAFYSEIIGLKLIRRFKPSETMEIAFLGEGETQVELIYNANNQNVAFGKDISIGFEIESTSDFIKVLKTKEIELHSGPFQPNPNIRFFYIQDPDGLLIQLIENIKG